MSSMSSVAGLSKYITTLPKTKLSICGMLIISFLIASFYCLVDKGEVTAARDGQVAAPRLSIKITSPISTGIEPVHSSNSTS